MKARGSYQPKGASANATDYYWAFLRRAHSLLGRGYAVLEPSKYSRAEEEDITGDLVQAMQIVEDDPNAPRWVTLFSVHGEAGIHDPKRKGKRRRRLDIRIDSAAQRPRNRLSFEAKRLGPNHGASVYLGENGLQRFIDGRYAKGETSAGMLGYVQAGSPDEWAEKIEKAIARNAVKLHPLTSSPWRREQLVVELTHTYRSGHSRPSVGQPVEIYHTLLPFN